MSRFAIFILVALFLGWSHPVTAAGGPILKPSVTVTGPVIHLGDLFDGVGERASVGVAEAPPPGSRMTLSSAWLAALARSQHLAWQPASSMDQATVARASRIIDAEQIIDQLKEALARRMPLDDADIRLDRAEPRLVVAAEAPAILAFDSISYDSASGRFIATVSTSDAGSVTNQLRLSGQIVRFAEVPTPVRSIAPGETIAKDDLVVVRLRSDRLAPGAVMQLADLVGKTPRRPLRTGEAVRAGEVEVPVVVHRNSLVTIVLETPTMRLTAEGKAEEDGSMGAIIRISNTKSSRVIDAIVTGPNSVRVENPS